MRTRVRRLAGSLAIWWKFNAYARVNALFQLRCALFRLKITQKRPQRIGRLFVGAHECVCVCVVSSVNVYILWLGILSYTTMAIAPGGTQLRSENKPNFMFRRTAGMKWAFFSALGGAVHSTERIISSIWVRVCRFRVVKCINLMCVCVCDLWRNVGRHPQKNMFMWFMFCDI